MRLWSCAVALACGALLATPASAQTGRPYRGLFGGGTGNWEQSLVFTMSFMGGYDTEALTAAAPLPGSGSGEAPAPRNQHSSFETASALLGYTLAKSRVAFSASAGVGGTYYQVLAKTITRYDGDVSGSFQISKRTRLSGSQGIAYQPLRFPGAFPAGGTLGGGGPIILPENADTVGLRLTNYVTQSSQVDLSQQLARRVSVSLNYGRTQSTFGSNDRVTTQEASGRITAGVTRHLSVYAGDGYFDSESRVGGRIGRTRGQHALFGLGYDRATALSLSRHLTLSLGIGASAFSDVHRLRLAATGDALLNWEIGRSWTAAGGYRRSVGFVDVFQQPVTSDTVTATLGGLISRRVSAQASAGASQNHVGFTGPSNMYRNYYSAAGVSVAITRSVALGLGYSYYRTRFDSGLQLPSGLFHQMNRQSVYVFVNLWEPLFQRVGRVNASR
jgi:hypothetical protein